MRTPQIRRPRLTYANVVSTFALLIATSMGGAYAHGMISSSEIQNNAVKTRHIGAGQVKTPDLAASAVKTGKIANNAVNGAKVRDGSLGGHDLARRATGIALAGITVNGSTLVHQFNRLGGAVSVQRTSAGNYTVTIPGANFNGYSRAMVTFGGKYDGYCYLNNATGNQAFVVCATFADVDEDSYFNMVLYRDATGALVRGSARTSQR